MSYKKRVIRIITKSEPYAHTSPIFHKYGLLDIVNIHSLQVGLFMFLFNKKLLLQTIQCSIQCFKKALRYIVTQPEALATVEQTSVEQT